MVRCLGGIQAGGDDGDEGSELDRALEVYDRLNELAERRNGARAAPAKVSDVAYVLAEAMKPGGVGTAILAGLLAPRAGLAAQAAEGVAAAPEPATSAPAQIELTGPAPGVPVAAVTVEPAEPAARFTGRLAAVEATVAEPSTVDDDPFAAAEAAFERFHEFAEDQPPFIRAAIFAVMGSLTQAEDKDVVAYLGQFEGDPAWVPLIMRLRNDPHWGAACLARLRRLIANEFGQVEASAEEGEEAPAMPLSKNGHGG